MKEAVRPSQTIEINVPADFRQMRLRLSLPTVIVLAATTVLLLSVMQEPIGWSFAAWFALAPWAVALVGAPSGGRAALVSFGIGFIYYLANLYWLAPITLPGYIAVCFYLGWYFVFTGYILRHVYLRHRWPFTLVLPVLWVGQEYLRALLFTGFPWLFLGHSQHDHPYLIQMADAVGVYGLTFLIGMVNGLICDLLLRPIRRNQQSKRRLLLSARVLLLLVGAVLLGTLLYGGYRLEEGNRTISPGKTIAVVQEVIPQYVKQSGQSDEEIFAGHLALSQQALAAPVRPDLIVWPETMVVSPLNKEFLTMESDRLSEAGLRFQAQSLSYDRRLREHAAQGAALLIGSPGLEIDPAGEELSFNSAILYLADGSRYPRRYDKMHLVPFGEVVPFKKSWPGLHDFLNHLTPYSYDYTLDAGEHPTVFEFTAADGSMNRFAVAICYEDVMPQVPRRLAAVEDGKKRIDFLLNISNDGWFVRGGGAQPVKASAELMQHLVICKFRAVENRVGIVRAVNTGISGFIQPDGTVQRAPLAGTLPAQPRQRQAVAGFLTDRVYLDTRVSLYNRIGDSFAAVCTMLMSALLLDGVYGYWRTRCEIRSKIKDQKSN